ncbi:MAG TPA: GNAT family N-acetyltransferase [Candidatus Hydromicrobium sp.]
MSKFLIKELGEYKPNSFNSLNLNKLKEFVIVPYFIDWYRSRESNKIYPLFVQEIESLNPTFFRLPGFVGRNPFFDHTQVKFFIAYNDGRPAGRVMSFIDYNYNEKYNDRFGWFGLFESIENKDLALMLLDRAVDYLKKNGCRKIIGPAKFNAGGEIGLLIDGFENKPYFLEPYNAPYYKDIFEEYGLVKENDWYSVVTDSIISRDYMDRVERVLLKISNKDHKTLNEIKIRNVNFQDYRNEIKIIKELYNTIWNSENHPQQVRMTDAEFNLQALGIKAISIEDLIFIIEKDDVPIGISVNLPDINEVIEDFDSKWLHIPSKHFFNLRDLSRDIKIFNLIQKKLKTDGFTRLRILLLGIKKEFRKAGIESKVFFKINKDAVNLGFKYASGSQLADINLDIINPIFRLGKVAFTWRVYGLDI